MENCMLFWVVLEIENTKTFSNYLKNIIILFPQQQSLDKSPSLNGMFINLYFLDMKAILKLQNEIRAWQYCFR